ncbi:MAG: sugar ABC transporter ATP-binding protein, partial [Candidatus Aminicenantes bacterium]|nr:sugar ABC transporter ATP-binding protein [Candidatus Aminicenantes bacterium]
MSTGCNDLRARRVGRIQFDPQIAEILGLPVAVRNPRDAQALGIAAVYQDLALVDCRDIAANIFLGREPTRGPLVNRKKMLAESEQVLKK